MLEPIPSPKFQFQELIGSISCFPPSHQQFVTTHQESRGVLQPTLLLVAVHEPLVVVAAGGGGSAALHPPAVRHLDRLGAPFEGGTDEQFEVAGTRQDCPAGAGTVLVEHPGIGHAQLEGGNDVVIVDRGEPVREAIRSRNRDRSGGEIDAGKRQYLLRTIGRFEDVGALDQLILARRGDAVIRLSDVAAVRLDHFEKQVVTSFNGSKNLFVVLRREAGSNVIDIKRAMMLEIEAINREVLEPAGLQIEPIADDVRYVEESIRNVWKNLVLGALLATAVMFLFLRSARATLVGVLGIPICVIVAFLGLLLAGRTVNVISLAGIAFAIGMTLDNSIVVLESIELERRKGADRYRAAIEGVRQVWPAVFASTMTTVMVFLPVAFVEQEAGQLYSDVAVAISAAILASMLVAVTVLPTAAARLDFDTGAARGRGERVRQAALSLVTGCIATPVRRLTCIAITVLASAAVILLLTPPAEYLPEGEEPKVFAAMNAPPGYNLAAMTDIGAEIQQYLLQYLDADPALFHRGEHEVPAVDYFNMRIRSDQVRVISEPVDPADVDALMDALSRKYRKHNE